MRVVILARVIETETSRRKEGGSSVTSGQLFIMSVEELKEKIQQLEAELKQLRDDKGCAREKIAQMSGEVVDSNPYR